MAFMEPEYEYGEFVRSRADFGEEFLTPSDIYSEYDHGKETDRQTGWFYRLSASGYLDCTEWTGPFETEDEAREALSAEFDCDPDTGDDFEDE